MDAWKPDGLTELPNRANVEAAMLKLSCKEASRLLSEARERKLGPGEQLALSLHLKVCAGCENFRKQLDFMSAAMRRFLRRDE